jgi:hypothetical protein
MFMVVASIVLAVGLFGCNRQQQVAEQAPVAVAPPPAAAPPPPAPPAPVMEATRHLRHHHGRAQRSSYESYSESESTSYRQSDESEYEGDGDVETYDRSAASEVHGEVWVDGYGREHTAVATPDDNPGALSREDERLRRKVWRGWNSDCDRR